MLDTSMCNLDSPLAILPKLELSKSCGRKKIHKIDIILFHSRTKQRVGFGKNKKK